MNARKTEDHHHTPEQTAEYLAQALAICDESDLAHDERVAVLPVLVTILSSKQIFYEQVAPMMALPGSARH